MTELKAFSFDAEFVPMVDDAGKRVDHPGIPIGLVNWHLDSLWSTVRLSVLSVSRKGISARDAMMVFRGLNYKTAPERSVRGELEKIIEEFSRLGSIEYARRYAGDRKRKPVPKAPGRR